MKSPQELSVKIARQWSNAALREARLLDYPDAYPFHLNIGKPPASYVKDSTTTVREHCQKWRSVCTGTIHWKNANYRSTNEEVEYPDQWEISSDQEWLEVISMAKGSEFKGIAEEFKFLTEYLQGSDSAFHCLLIRRRSLWRNRSNEDVVKSLFLASELKPGSANGLPLRALPYEGIDTKFFERNRPLLLALLDELYDYEATEQGLEAFLAATSERGHWLLIIDLDGSLLPFDQIRLRSDELAQTVLPGSHLLIIENETCQHQLPRLHDTLAVLGSGFDLAWTSAEWLKQKTITYWGDLDTWGLEMLGRARKNIPHLTPILMTRETFTDYQDQSVQEKSPAPVNPHLSLTENEKQLYQYLRGLALGRLEQEYLPPSLVERELIQWRNL